MYFFCSEKAEHSGRRRECTLGFVAQIDRHGQFKLEGQVMSMNRSSHCCKYHNQIRIDSGVILEATGNKVDCCIPM